MPPLLEVRDLTIDFPTKSGWARVVDQVTFSVSAGEVVGVAGESGSGKTLTALSIMRLLPTTRVRLTGSISFEGREVLSLSARALRDLRGKNIAMVFQEPMVSIHPAWTIGEQIAEGIRAHEEVSRRQAQRRALEMLDLVKIPEPARRAHEYAHEMSGGMLQRVMIGMALACRPKLLIADEPTTALDVTVQAQILDLLQELQRDLGMALIFVSHDLGLVASLCERVLIMYGGQIVEDGGVESIFRAPEHPYTEALMAAVIRPEQKGGVLPTIRGFPPDAGAMTAGCRFAPRCSYAMRSCVETSPPLETLAAGGRSRCLRRRELELCGARR